MTILYVFSIICVAVIVRADIKSRVIPDAWLWPLALCGIWSFGGDLNHVIAACAGYAIGFALMVAGIKKDALGYGDVKLMCAAGLWLGIDGLSFSVVSACVAGIIWGLIRRQKYVPFAPFLFAGAGIYYFLKNCMAIF